MENMSIIEKLNKLANFRAQRDILRLEAIKMIDAIITPEIQAQINEIEAEFADKSAAVNANISELEQQIKDDVKAHGDTVKGDFLIATWNKGRTSWDTKALDGYAAAHPEIAQFKTIGEPSVSIRDR